MSSTSFYIASTIWPFASFGLTPYKHSKKAFNTKIKKLAGLQSAFFYILFRLFKTLALAILLSIMVHLQKFWRAAHYLYQLTVWQKSTSKESKMYCWPAHILFSCKVPSKRKTRTQCHVLFPQSIVGKCALSAKHIQCEFRTGLPFKHRLCKAFFTPFWSHSCSPSPNRCRNGQRRCYFPVALAALQVDYMLVTQSIISSTCAILPVLHFAKNGRQFENI